MKQLTMLGGRTGGEQFRPYAPGDVLVKHNGSRYCLTQVCDVGVYACTNVATGGEAIVLEREIAYRLC